MDWRVLGWGSSSWALYPWSILSSCSWLRSDRGIKTTFFCKVITTYTIWSFQVGQKSKFLTSWMQTLVYLKVEKWIEEVMSNSTQRPFCNPLKPKIIPKPLLFWEIYGNWSRSYVKGQLVKIKEYINKPKELLRINTSSLSGLSFILHSRLFSWVICLPDSLLCFLPTNEFLSSEFSLNIIYTNKQD